MNTNQTFSAGLLDGKLQALIKATAVASLIALTPFTSQADNPDSKQDSGMQPAVHWK